MAQQFLPQGTILSNRFQLEAPAGQSDLGVVYKAKDQKNDHTVVLRVIPTSLFKSEKEMSELRSRIKTTSSLTHKNIRSIFGMGNHENTLLCLAAEWIDGQNLRALLRKRKKEGKRFSFKGAYNIIGHICNALTYAHKNTFHGTLSPMAIMVSNAGRVKICDFGLSMLRSKIAKTTGHKNVETEFWAPEVLHGKTQDNPILSDVYSVGAIFYELITGEAPVLPIKAPSRLGFSTEVDQIIAKCMNPDPKKRFQDAASIKAAVAEIIRNQTSADTQEAANTDDDLGINIEIDLDGMRLTSHPPGPIPDGGKDNGSMLNAPGLPPPPNGNADGDISDQRVSTIDMGEVLSGLSNTEAARWMVQKDKFDHGPFTDRELVQMILLGDVLGKHQLLNMDTGVRKKVRTWGEFDTYLERYRLKKKQQEEEQARMRTEKAEARGTMAAWLIVLIVVGVIGLVTGGYLLTRTLRKEKTFTPEEMVAALESGEIKLKTGGSLIKKGKRRGRGHRKGGSSGGGEKFVDGMSYEDAMNMGVQLGSLSNNAGQKQLSPQDITRIMDKNVRRFLPCVAGQNVKKVEMNIAIAGDGRVMGISVAQGSAKLKKCVASKVRAIKFPKSAAPRTAASWFFELY